MPQMYNEFIQVQIDDSEKVFKNEMVKIQNGDKENDKCSVYNSNRGVINVCRTWISKLVSRVRGITAGGN